MSPQKTTIDYLRHRTQAEPPAILDAMRPLFGTLGPDLAIRHAGRGRDGWTQAAQIVVEDLVIGRMDFGGESQRGWVRTDLPGKGCEWVQDWDAIDDLVALGAVPRRIDLALTTWQGQVGHDQLVQAHSDGRFRCGGRPPDLQQITSSNPRAGRTCYVGKREKADKFLRGYERGFLLAAGMPGTVETIDGFPIEGIYRTEVELKAATRELEWGVIERRDQYFAGAYPFCADVLPGVEADILQRRKERAPQADLAMALAHCRTQFGSVLYTALRAYRGDMTAVWDKVIGDHHCKPLLEAGVLLVDHE